MEVYREILPQSYLLILTDTDPTDAGAPAASLAYALRRASRSGKSSIWVDCSHLRRLPLSALRVLLRYYRRLQQRNVSLVLCHVGTATHQLAAKLPTAAFPAVLPSLLDAERYCNRRQSAVPLAA
ncbi:STAS domain-containing protein [Hymenobacter mucosus]|uniref:STAS domain-containing protein n=1 Tax=Hymenobacter mucosus TaxID=1411120 RepID=A0A238X655_9BACT|nr:STAS domain-containing protein [Hymenobacter mucosus]SNR54170.1 STAS domain-containing protein [Hymenobacter mucosus]